ncbi:MAG TPA: DUF4136 domain-containing protein [Cyclobacteriaceae bacterium]
MRTVLIILGLFIFFGCSTQPQLSEVVNDMVVLTHYEPSANFPQLATYVLRMDVVGLSSNTTSATALKNDYSKMITAQIKRNLDQANHIQVDSTQNPDIGVTVLIVNNLSISQSYYPGGYYYPSYYGYGYGYGYGGYRGGYVTTNYFQSAMLVIEFVDLKDKGAGKPASIWVANIGDLVNSYDTSTKTREAIDQAFVQSEYLKR